LTLTFKLVRTSDQARLPYKFGSNPFSTSRDISNKKPQTDGAKNRTFRSSLRAVVKDKSVSVVVITTAVFTRLFLCV